MVWNALLEGTGCVAATGVRLPRLRSRRCTARDAYDAAALHQLVTKLIQVGSFFFLPGGTAGHLGLHRGACLRDLIECHHHTAGCNVQPSKLLAYVCSHPLPNVGLSLTCQSDLTLSERGRDQYIWSRSSCTQIFGTALADDRLQSTLHWHNR